MRGNGSLNSISGCNKSPTLAGTNHNGNVFMLSSCPLLHSGLGQRTTPYCPSRWPLPCLPNTPQADAVFAHLWLSFYYQSKDSSLSWAHLYRNARRLRLGRGAVWWMLYMTIWVSPRPGDRLPDESNAPMNNGVRGVSISSNNPLWPLCSFTGTMDDRVRQKYARPWFIVSLRVHISVPLSVLRGPSARRCFTLLSELWPCTAY